MTKIIYFDIDGTLRSEMNKVSPKTKYAIEQCSKKGIICVICTGRNPGSIQEDIKELPMSGVISGGGCFVKYKNKMLAKFINEKLAGKVENKQLFIDGDAEDPIAVPLDLEPETGFSEKDDLSPDEVVESREEEDENKKIFKELNRIVVQDQLYLSPELSREDLAQIVHLNNARFARMIKENTGTNFNGYINELRINYAIQLLKQHPNYTIRAIADEAGFNSTPILYSMFKKKTGMTPYEFKKTQESLG